MQHGTNRPLLFQLLHGQPLEQLFPSLEIRLEGRDHKTFAETPGTAEKVIFTRIHQPKKQCRLIYINITTFSYLAEILYPDGVFPVHSRFK